MFNIAEVAVISNYNVRFSSETHDMFTMDQSNKLLPVNYHEIMDTSMYDLEGISTQPHIQSGQMLTSEEPSNEMFLTIQVPTNQSTNGLAEANFEIDQQMEMSVTDQQMEMSVNEKQNSCSQSSCCKGYQKILNKIDYFQKKNSKDIGLLRQELSSNSKLLVQLLNSLQQSEDHTEVNGNVANEHIQDEPAQLNI